MDVREQATVTPIDIVFIPDYILTTLEANKITLSSIDSLARSYSDTKDHRIMDNFKESISNKLSVTDLTDIVTTNNIVYKALFNMNRYKKDGHTSDFLLNACDYAVMDKSSYSYNLNKEELEVLNILIDPNKEIDTIIVSGDKNEIYSTVVTDNTLFVVLHEGFGNVLIRNDYDKSTVLKGLIDYTIKSFSYERIKYTNILKQFIRLV